MVTEEQLRTNKWLINALHENLTNEANRYIRTLSQNSKKDIVFDEFVGLAIGDLETAKENLEDLPLHFSLEIETLIEEIGDYHIDKKKFKLSENLVPSKEILFQNHFATIHEEGAFSSFYAHYLNQISPLILNRFTEWVKNNTVKSFS